MKLIPGEELGTETNTDWCKGTWRYGRAPYQMQPATGPSGHFKRTTIPGADPLIGWLHKRETSVSTGDRGVNVMELGATCHVLFS